MKNYFGKRFGIIKFVFKNNYKLLLVFLISLVAATSIIYLVPFIENGAYVGDVRDIDNWGCIQPKLIHLRSVGSNTDDITFDSLSFAGIINTYGYGLIMIFLVSFFTILFINIIFVKDIKKNTLGIWLSVPFSRPSLFISKIFATFLINALLTFSVIVTTELLMFSAWDGTKMMNYVLLASFSFLLLNITICSINIFIGLFLIENVVLANSLMIIANVLIVIFESLNLIYQIDPENIFKNLYVFKYLSLKNMFTIYLSFSTTEFTSSTKFVSGVVMITDYFNVSSPPVFYQLFDIVLPFSVIVFLQSINIYKIKKNDFYV